MIVARGRENKIFLDKNEGYLVFCKKKMAMEEKMPIVTLKTKGQMTLPKEVRREMDLKPSEKMMISVEGNLIIIRPLKGSILDIGGSIPISESLKPIGFKKVRKEVWKHIGQKAAVSRDKDK
ncbi:MAG: AbrB/MazE/SpoVT family DNA-binding domain-containing protein [Deltaproteobacteria bacterium]|nr:AbrB/MazE/SpoVT family DNA-binding domain-containing protein [Deltaproteobacteria bacterium]